jgi:isoleucyl-tRNA synthetase
MAPFTPFVAEDVYQKVKGSDGKESVHLESWPDFAEASSGETKVLEEMAEVRKIVSLGLEARAKANSKVRQPLQSLTLGKELAAPYQEVLKDELNVKEIKLNKDLGQNVELDTTITQELKREGQARDFIRLVQELRKKMKLNPGELVTLTIATNEDGQKLIETFKTDISKTAQLSEIVFAATEGESMSVDDLSFVVAITK